ncbi:MAG: efflux RND transporter periplasmic adaptor subunit [Gemmatimonadetes bacterium]|nr:efflux RND transporter periplasmic adaptor subunit [Gemmatimonadota bacterium]
MIRRRQLLILFAIVVVAFLIIVWMRRGGGEEQEVTPTVAVHVDSIRRATLRHTVTAYGTVQPSPALNGKPAGGAVITPFVDGVVSEVDAVEGTRVREGTVLVRLDSRMAQAELERARSAADVAEQAFQRQEVLVKSNGTSQKAYLEAKAARDAARADLADAETGLAYVNITAPLSGTVLRMDAKVGQHVDAATQLAEVVDLNRLVVTTGVAAREIGGVAVGQRVLLGVGDSVPEGTVRIVGKDIDPADGTYRVQVSVPQGSGFRPGQFTEVHIVAGEHANVLVVPEESVITRPGEGTWIVVVEGDKAVHHPVTVGLRDRGLAEVSGEGVTEGMRVVTQEAYGLPNDTNVRVVGG